MLPTYSTGTVSVNNGGTTVTLVGGDWANPNAVAGDWISIDGLAPVLVTEATAALQLKIPPWQGVNKAGVPYVIYQNYVGRVVGVAAAEDVGELLSAMQTDGFIWFVKPTATAPDPSYGKDGQYALQPNTGAWWLKTAGVWGSSSAPVKGYGGTSATNLAIGTGAKVFATQLGLAYNGARVRAASAASPTTHFMEGVATYAGTTLTMTADVAQGAGSRADWLFSIAGQPSVAAPFDAMLSNGLQVNGAMEVSQEKGSTVGALASGNLYYPADQFFVVTSGAQAIGVQNVADAPAGFTRSAKITVTTANAALGAGDSCYIRTKIEGYRSAKLGFGAATAQSLSIGFWVKANRIGTYTGVVRNGAGNRSYPFSYAVAASNTWEYKSVTLAGDTAGVWDTTTGTGLDIFWLMAGGASVLAAAGAWAAAGYQGATGQVNGVAALTDTFQLTGVIVLPGSELPAAARSALAQRPFDVELALCKRYWRKSWPYGTAVGTAANSGIAYVNGPSISGTLATPVWFEVEMRAVPTVTLYDLTGAANMVYKTGNGRAAVVFFPSTKNFSGGTSDAVSGGELGFHHIADARL